MTSEFTFTGEMNFHQCVELAGAQYGTYGAGAWVKVISGEVSACSVLVHNFTTSDCSGYPSASCIAIRTEYDADWVLVGRVFEVNSAANIFKAVFNCWNESGPFSVRVDDFYLGIEIGSTFF